MTSHGPMKRTISTLALTVSLLASACGAGSHPAAAAPCDQACQDGVALRGLRTMVKFAFNLTVQGQPIGAQDKSQACLPSNGSAGKAHVFGNATSNAAQGSSFVDLSFDFTGCAYPAPPDPSADQNFNVTVDGLITEQGTLAVQPSATTALMFHSDALSITGTVYDPPLDYAASECVLDLNQDGNALAGTWCGRAAGFSF
jgi:hypothetical protein